MSEKEEVLCAFEEFEKTLNALKLPCIVVVGLPATGEFIRLAGGMESEINRAIVASQVIDLIHIAAAKGGAS